jgi:Predicted membrane protein
MFESVIPIINEFLFNYGYLSLFISALLAASLIPLSPEILIAMMCGTHNFWGIIIVATTGSFLGSVTTYALGYWGIRKISKKIVIVKPDKYERGKELFEKYGAWILLFTSVPIVGDAFAFVAGVARYNFKYFSILVIIGKFARFFIVVVLCRLGYDITASLA